MKTFITFTGIVILTACNSNQKNSTVTLDSAATQNTLASEEMKDPFEKLKDFTIDFYSLDYENLIKELKDNKRLQVVTNTDEDGDVSPIVVTLFTDSLKNSEFLLSELNLGDEGFGIHQFYTENDILLKARTYAVAPNKTGKGFQVEEEILDFKADKVEVRQRIKDIATRDSASYSLSDVPFKNFIGNKQELLKEYTNMFNDMKAPVKK
jgi:hypothetical protein